MKKIIALIVATLLIVTLLCGCNKQIIDLNYEFDYAIIELQNGEVIEGRVESWKDYDGEQLQVKIDGVIYLTNSFNCTLIKKGGVEE